MLPIGCVWQTAERRKEVAEVRWRQRIKLSYGDRCLSDAQSRAIPVRDARDVGKRRPLVEPLEHRRQRVVRLPQEGDVDERKELEQRNAHLPLPIRPAEGDPHGPMTMLDLCGECQR